MRASRKVLGSQRDRPRRRVGDFEHLAVDDRDWSSLQSVVTNDRQPRIDCLLQ